jgi:hypothetical protein
MRIHRALFPIASCFLLLPECSLLVSEDVTRVRCSAEGAIGPPNCDPSEICAARRCRACAEKEACGDGIDNDCNSLVDDHCSLAAGGAPGDIAPGSAAAGG